MQKVSIETQHVSGIIQKLSSAWNRKGGNENEKNYCN
jgi:hypothetical protein